MCFCQRPPPRQLTRPRPRPDSPRLAMSRLSMFGGSPAPSTGPSTPPSTSKRQPSYLSSQLTHLSLGSSPGPPPAQSIIDRPLNRMRGAEIGMAAWAFLYSGIIAYSQNRVESVVELENRLASIGREAGKRIIALQMLRNAQTANLKVRHFSMQARD